MWPDNEPALSVFIRAGTKWRYPAMGGTPIGLEWPSVYPLINRHDPADFETLHDDIQIMEISAMDTMREYEKEVKNGGKNKP